VLQDARLDNRPLVPASLVEDVKCEAKDHGAAPQQTGPIHCGEGDGDCGGEKGEDHDEDGPEEGEDVGCDAEAAEAEGTVVDARGVGDAIVQQQADGQDIGAEKAGDDEGGDGVKSGRRADVDQAEEHGDERGEGNGVEGQLCTGFDVGQVTGAGDAVVSSKGPHDTGRRGEGGDTGKDHEGEDDRDHGGGAAIGPCGLGEDLDEGKAGGGTECIADVANAEEDGDEHGEA
jgi:hypothetical protein